MNLTPTSLKELLPGGGHGCFNLLAFCTVNLIYVTLM